MAITGRQQSNIVAFCFLILFSSALNIVPGFYYADVVVFLGIFRLLFKRNITITANEGQYLYLVILLILLPNCLFILYQMVTGIELGIFSIYIIYNVTLSLLYVFFIKEYLLGYSYRNVELMTFLFMVPLFIAIGMFFSPQVNQAATIIYGIEQIYDGRFGGVWGKNVNQLGYYATVIMVWSVFLIASGRIGKFFYGFVQFVCIFIILISGMRAGIVVYLFSLILTSFLSKQIRSVLILNITTAIIFAFVLILISPFIVEKFDLELIVNRFSLELFFGQLTGNSGDAHVGNMYKKWFEIFFSNPDLGDLLFSMGGYWKFPDSFVIFYFANAGLVGVGLLLVFLMLCLYKLIHRKLYIGLFLFLFLGGMAFKGNFPLNNFSMFVFTLIIYMNDFLEVETYKQKNTEFIS